MTSHDEITTLLRQLDATGPTSFRDLYINRLCTDRGYTYTRAVHFADRHLGFRTAENERMGRAA